MASRFCSFFPCPRCRISARWHPRTCRPPGITSPWSWRASSRSKPSCGNALGSQNAGAWLFPRFFLGEKRCGGCHQIHQCFGRQVTSESNAWRGLTASGRDARGWVQDTQICAPVWLGEWNWKVLSEVAIKADRLSSFSPLAILGGVP